MAAIIEKHPGLATRATAAINRHPLATRWILAGPVAVAAALATLAAMPLWVPPGAAGVNNLALPIILTPLLWAVPFFYVCLTENLPRAALILGGATLGQAAAVALALGASA